MMSREMTSRKLMTSEDYAKLCIRLALAFVFLWFGIDKFIHPAYWSSWVPAWQLALFPFSATALMYLVGAVEAVLGLLLAAGLFVRAAAAIAAAHLLHIVIMLGFSDIAVRDFALFLTAAALFLIKSHPLSVDGLLRRAGMRR